ncbi:hypothetical protein BGZ96_001993, partial [Linnemannia gamsii]
MWKALLGLLVNMDLNARTVSKKKTSVDGDYIEFSVQTAEGINTMLAAGILDAE